MTSDFLSILGSIGSMLSGLSFVSAFVLYRKTKRDEYVASVKSSFIDVSRFLSTINNFVSTDEVYKSVNTYLSIKYVQLTIRKFSEYIVENLNLTSEDAYTYWKDEISAQLKYIPSARYNLIDEGIDSIANNLDRLLIHELSKIELFVVLVQQYKAMIEAHSLKINEILTTDEAAIKGICKTLCDNKSILLDFDSTKQRIIKSYVDYVNSKLKNNQEVLSKLERFIRIIAKEFGGLSDTNIFKLSKVRINTDIFLDCDLHKGLSDLLDNVPSFAIKKQVRTQLHELVGEIKQQVLS